MLVVAMKYGVLVGYYEENGVVEAVRRVVCCSFNSSSDNIRTGWPPC